MQLLPVERVVASEIIKNIAEMDSNAACSSHGSAEPYDIEKLKRRLLLYKFHLKTR